jgi:hypothetical protein
MESWGWQKSEIRESRSGLIAGNCEGHIWQFFADAANSPLPDQSGRIHREQATK